MTNDRNTRLLSASPPKSKEEFAYQTLREAIINGLFEPGMELVQTALAEQLGISTIPVRTAIHRLATEGLVSLADNRSPTVAVLSAEELEEILLIRMHLETLAAELSFPKLQAEDLEALWDLVDEMDEVVEQGAMHLYGAMNKKFHMRMYDACQCPLLIQMIKDLWDNSDRHRSRAMFVSVPGLAEQSDRQHHRLLQLLEDNRPDDAVALLRRHKSSARERFLEALEEKPAERVEV